MRFEAEIAFTRNAMAVSSVGREVGWRGVSEAGK